jgi:predicted nucleic acid-binding protein
MILDANVLLRVMDGPEHPLHTRAAGMVRDAIDQGQVLRVLPTTLSELAFVLASSAAGYGLSRAAIVDALEAILDDPQLSVEEPDACRRAVELYAAHPIDLDDCYLAAKAERGGERVLSLDVDFDRLRKSGLAI